MCKVPVQPVSEQAPVLDRPTKPAYLDGIENISLDKKISNQAAFDDLFSDMEVVDKSWFILNMIQWFKQIQLKVLENLMVRVLESKRQEKLFL